MPIYNLKWIFLGSLKSQTVALEAVLAVVGYEKTAYLARGGCWIWEKVHIWQMGCGIRENVVCCGMVVGLFPAVP